MTRRPTARSRRRRSLRRGRLVAVEGIDGAGKSTLARALVREARRRGVRAALWHEPSDRALGTLAQRVGRYDPWSSAVYFTVDRHLARPALERRLAHHDLVVSDRSFYSTLAYQGSALAVRDRRRLAELQRTAARRPDLVVLLDLSPREALARLRRRGRRRGPLEEVVTLERVARAYRALANEGRWRVIDATTPTAATVRALLPKLAARRGLRVRGGRR